ncbi:MAG TPA: hypothetical protein VJS17_01330, partial [Pyrinomonadaceae bacterium]|nr:hypothetical protein [Pyrinomonadaceae bacterium]
PYSTSLHRRIVRFEIRAVNTFSGFFSETAGAAHGAVIAGLTAGIDRALLFVFEELNQFRNGGLFNSETFLTWV